MIELVLENKIDSAVNNRNIARKIREKIVDFLLRSGKGDIPVSVEPTMNGMTVTVGIHGSTSPVPSQTSSFIPEFDIDTYLFGKTIHVDSNGDQASTKSEVKSIIEKTLLDNILKTEVK